jgi:hypothetical protein
MKNSNALFAVALGAVLAVPALASAQAPGHPFALGLQVGDHFGFGAKYFFDRDDAIQGTIGWRSDWGYYGAPGPLLTIDWQHRVGTIVPRSGKVTVSFDVGVGGAAGYVGTYCGRDLLGRSQCYDNAELALRIPLSVSVYWPHPRLEAYAEVVPLLVAIPFFGPDLMGGIGGRFYF